MASAGRCLAVSWLWLFACLAIGGATDAGIMWPEGATDMELWNVLDELEPAIENNPLRIWDLAIRMVDMPGQRFGGAGQAHFWQANGYTDCE